MKMKRPKASHYESGPNMTPLVDIVMVILIFLMLVAKFVTSSVHYLATSVPYTPGGGGQVAKPAGWVPPTVLEIYVDPRLEGFVARVGSQQTDDPRTLSSMLLQQKSNIESTGTKPEDVQVQISPRGNTKFASLIAVFEAANAAGFSKIAFTGSRN
jgi:biopolymer transport protein ExbD